MLGALRENEQFIAMVLRAAEEVACAIRVELRDHAISGDRLAYVSVRTTASGIARGAGPVDLDGTRASVDGQASIV
jgi:hypothetical protein